jgi:hypothetical protein
MKMRCKCLLAGRIFQSRHPSLETLNAPGRPAWGHVPRADAYGEKVYQYHRDLFALPPEAISRAQSCNRRHRHSDADPEGSGRHRTPSSRRMDRDHRCLRPAMSFCRIKPSWTQCDGHKNSNRVSPADQRTLIFIDCINDRQHSISVHWISIILPGFLIRAGWGRTQWQQ